MPAAFRYRRAVKRVEAQGRGRVTVHLDCGHRSTVELTDQWAEKPEVLLGTTRECATCDRKRREAA